MISELFDRSSTDGRPSRQQAAVGGTAAALAAAICMAIARWGAQVRSLPERLVEWLLLFVPLDVFGAMLGAFGFEAKKYALDGAVLFSLALVALLGAAALRRGWSRPVLAALGPGLWLFAMVVVMPSKVPCSKCGGPSERGLCEACLEAIRELRELSLGFMDHE